MSSPEAQTSGTVLDSALSGAPDDSHENTCCGRMLHAAPKPGVCTAARRHVPLSSDTTIACYVHNTATEQLASASGKIGTTRCTTLVKVLSTGTATHPPPPTQTIKRSSAQRRSAADGQLAAGRASDKVSRDR